jgi:hypothetical protein
MPTQSSAFTGAKLLFTHEQRRQLAKLLNEAQPQGSHDKALAQMDRLAAKFRSDLRTLGFRPFVEILDQGISGREKRERLLGIQQAEELLRYLVFDIGRCWKETTGQPLPTLTTEVLDRCGLGYWPELSVIAASHPLWLVIDAVEVKLGALTVNHLVCWARWESGEKISVPKLFWPGFRPVRPHLLH